MRKKLLLFYLLFFFFLIDYAYAQLVGGLSNNYSIRHYTDEQGLPQNSVRAIFKDEGGFLWLATEGGVVRFDGESFKTYDKSVIGLASSRIVNFASGGDKNKSYAVTGKNELIEIRNGTVLSDKFYHLQDCFPRLAGRTAVIYLSVGIWDVDLELLDSSHYIIPNSLFEKPSYYECSGKELSLYTNNVVQRRTSIAVEGIKSFFRLDNDLYCFTNKGEIIELMNSAANPHSSGSLMELTGDITNESLHAGSEEESLLYWNTISNQVFLYRNKKCYQIVKQGNSNKLATRLVISGLDLKEMNVRAIFQEDGGRRLFLGSLTNGLYVIQKSEFLTVGLFDDSFNDIYYAQTPLSENAILTPNGRVVGPGMGVKDLQRNWIPLMKSVNEKDNYAILTDTKGFRWTKRKQIVYRYSPDGRHLLNQWDLKGRVGPICKGKDSKVWVGVDSQGIYCFNTDETKLSAEIFLRSKRLKVSCISQSDGASVWIGTEKGLYKLAIGARKMALVPGTANLFIRSIYTRSSSEVWFTTEQSGFFLYRNGKLIQFPVDENHYLASAHCILEDQKGFFWINTNRGIFQISRADLLSYFQGIHKDLFYMHYTKNQGLLSNEFNGGCEPCGIRLKNGFFSLPSMKGLVWFIPENISPDLPDKDIRLDNIDLQGEIKEVNSDTILLPENPERVRLVFTVPYFGNRENVSLSYKLVPGNYDSNDRGKWIKMDKMDLTLYLSSLRYGTYTLCVRKHNGFGENNFGYKFVTILVPPQWFETWWFKFLGVVLMLIGSFILNRISVYYLNKRNRLLESMVETRTLKLSEALRALEDSENKLSLQMKMQARLLAAVTHDIKTPLRSFQRIARKIKEFQQKGKFDEVTVIGEELTSSSGLMHEFLENLLCYIKFQVFNLEIKQESINLGMLINQKFALFQMAIAERNCKIINSVEEDIYVVSELQLLGVIIHNLIDNAIKATTNGIIEVFVERNGRDLQLVVRDNGKGMPLSLVAKLNEQDEQTIRRVDYNEDALGSGLGLIIVKELTFLTGLRIIAKVNAGTEIRIVFPENYD